jgi:hypothetical protein
MKDGYGKITVGGEYKGHIKTLVAALNKLKFHGDFEPGSEQFVEIGGRVTANKLENVPYPSAYPYRVRLKFKDGRHVFLDRASDLLMSEWKRQRTHAYEFEGPCSAELLSREISPLLTEGAIEFAAFVDDCGESNFSRIIVCSDGVVETSHRRKGSECSVSEIFVPRGPIPLAWTLEAYL